MLEETWQNNRLPEYMKDDSLDTKYNKYISFVFLNYKLVFLY